MAIAPWPTDQFLIAVPALADPDFAPGVTHICQHDHGGAMGFVSNRTADLTRGGALLHLKRPAEDGGIRSAADRQRAAASAAGAGEVDRDRHGSTHRGVLPRLPLAVPTG